LGGAWVEVNAGATFGDAPLRVAPRHVPKRCVIGSLHLYTPVEH
jgi:hypothetical protein